MTNQLVDNLSRQFVNFMSRIIRLLIVRKFGRRRLSSSDSSSTATLWFWVRFRRQRVRNWRRCFKSLGAEVGHGASRIGSWRPVPVQSWVRSPNSYRHFLQPALLCLPF